MNDDAKSPPEHAPGLDALPLEEDVRRLIVAQQRICDAPADAGAIRQLLVEMAQWVLDLDGAVLELIEGEDLVYSHASGILVAGIGMRVGRRGSLSALVIASGQPQLSDDVKKDTRVDAVTARRLGIGSMIVAPLRHAHDTVAVVTVAARESGRCTERHVALLQPLLQIAATRLERVAMSDEQRAADQLLMTIGEASREILAAGEPASQLCQWASRLLDAPFAVFLQPDADGNLVTTAQTGAPVAPMVLPPDKPSIMRSAFDSGRLQLIADYRNHADTSERVVEILDEAGLADTHSGAALPVTSGGKPIGV
ncbi:MAG: hypothetical protein QOF18_1564, partial [Frankiaceae bacterium]|nr:hypothetical protein [Frankiaceae bacterium]